MAYASGRRYLDADSHLVETIGFYRDYLDPKIRDRVRDAVADGRFPLEHLHEAERLRAASAFRDREVEEVMLRKMWTALGAFDAAERGRTLDALGFSAQLVFDSFMRGPLRELEEQDDMDLLYGAARAHHRAMTDFCSHDPRLLPVSYVPFADIDRAVSFARELIDTSCPAFEIPGECPRRHSTSHVGFDPLWAMAAEAGVPVLFHLGSSELATITFHENGLPLETFFAGGDVPRMGSVEYISSPMSVMQILSAMIFDGVLHRHPDLRIGLIELGASWLPGYLHFLDSAQIAFGKSEQRLQKLDMRASDYIKRQVRITPFCHENVGWLIDQVGPDVAMFSSDYPHIEGGRNPIARFEASLDASGITPGARDKFYEHNFVDLLGGRIPALS